MMTVTLKIPSPLRRFTDHSSAVDVDADSVATALDQLFILYPDLKLQVMDENGQLRNFVNLFHDKVDIRQQQGLNTRLHQGSELRIVPAIAGGSGAKSRLSALELGRYSRHIMLPEMGIEGQESLKSASILIIGAGGLGCPLGLYLAAAGVGHLGIVDNDVVDESNLQRQVLYTVDDIGKPKVDCAAARLYLLNPYIEISCYPELLTSANAMKLIEPYDLVIDGTDNFPTRYLVNDACVLLNKPNIYGSIFRFDGQATVFNYQQGPCYRCLYPSPPPPGLVPSCAEGGVLGVLPAVIASIQATEAIKILTNVGDSLSGKLLLYDALQMEFEYLQIEKNPNCPLCGLHPSIHVLIDYQQFCGITTSTEPCSYQDISPQMLKLWLDAKKPVVLIDVRESYEREICKIMESQHISMAQIDAHMAEFNTEQVLVVHCKLGGRSAKVCQQFTDQGYKHVFNLTGGILVWADAIDDKLIRY
ncbi:molybdopterin-synthase adenylyltransferase MoeB [Moritella viscosa]|uniref:molybdopterin-synthase adenylyltransferase MoeB n=1 Tax=Moritella viscosa TaxID=80854 RepID=UPI000AFCE799|nr:molybdopterin-synthase adenylyltransferase MoeB [Moritella viscosa]